MSHYVVETVTHEELEKSSTGGVEQDLAAYLNEHAKNGRTLVSVLPASYGFSCVWVEAEAKTKK